MKKTLVKQWNVATDITKLKAKTDNEQWGTVYAVEYGKHLKIGFTKDLIKRVKNFLHQTKYNQVAIKKIAFTPYHSNYNDNERLLHDLFRDFREKGTELFDISLKEFLDKVPELQLDKTIVDYSQDADELKKSKSIIPTNAALIPINEEITLPVREYNGERVVTFKDIDFAHKRPTGTAKRNFYNFQKRFIEKVDYFKIKLTQYATRTEFGFEKNASTGILITKMGYLMLVKPFTDDLSWAIQRLLVVKYFDSMPNKDTEFVSTLENLFKNRERVNVGAINNMIYETTINEMPAIEATAKLFKCNIDTVGYTDKETAKKKTGAIVNRMKSKDGIKELTIHQLAETVAQGISFTTASLSGTTEKDFVSQQLAVVDIDNDNKDIPALTVDDAVRTLTELKIDYAFMYYSFSHSTQIPKFRIVCVLDEPITDPLQAKRLNQYLISLFPQADKSCFNLDRFYYGTDKGLATTVHNRTANIEVPDTFGASAETPPPAEPQTVPIGDHGNEAKPKTDAKFNLTQAIRDFDLAGYVEQATGTKGERKGKDILFNPCPLCGHKDHFYIDTERNLFKCHSNRNGTGGNIINYIMQKNPSFDIKQARDYFKYDILKRDREADKAAFKKAKRAEAKANGEEEEQYEELTISGVERHLRIIGVTAKYNKITRKIDIKGLDAKHSREHITDSLPVLVYNDLKRFFTNCAKGDVQDFLGVIATDNAYNPVLEMIEGGKWDGVDRLPELYRIMRIDDSDTLSKVLIYKWFWQGLSMARNEYDGAYGADGLLVLQGGQGIGKTTLVRKMAVRQEFCLIGKSLNFQDKDTLRRCASSWIVELGEIETTFRSDKEKLKAFITDEIDMYRLPYGRTDIELARRTSLIGTCNSTEYLIDETGNRRFWTVPVRERMDLVALDKFDFLQLWLQIDTVAKHNIQGFRLSIEEQAALAERNGKHEKPLKGEIEVRDILSVFANDNRYLEKEVTITEFKAEHRQLDKYSAEQIGKVLDKMGIEAKRTNKGRFRILPMIALDYKY